MFKAFRRSPLPSLVTANMPGSVMSKLKPPQSLDQASLEGSRRKCNEDKDLVAPPIVLSPGGIESFLMLLFINQIKHQSGGLLAFFLDPGIWSWCSFLPKQSANG